MYASFVRGSSNCRKRHNQRNRDPKWGEVAQRHDPAASSTRVLQVPIDTWGAKVRTRVENCRKVQQDLAAHRAVAFERDANHLGKATNATAISKTDEAAVVEDVKGSPRMPEPLQKLSANSPYLSSPSGDATLSGLEHSSSDVVADSDSPLWRPALSPRNADQPKDLSVAEQRQRREGQTIMRLLGSEHAEEWNNRQGKSESKQNIDGNEENKDPTSEGTQSSPASPCRSDRPNFGGRQKTPQGSQTGKSPGMDGHPTVPQGLNAVVWAARGPDFFSTMGRVKELLDTKKPGSKHRTAIWDFQDMQRRANALAKTKQRVGRFDARWKKQLKIEDRANQEREMQESHRRVSQDPGALDRLKNNCSSPQGDSKKRKSAKPEKQVIELKYSVVNWSSERPTALAKSLEQTGGCWETAPMATKNQWVVFELSDPDTVYGMSMNLPGSENIGGNPHFCEIQYSEESAEGPWRYAAEVCVFNKRDRELTCTFDFECNANDFKHFLATKYGSIESAWTTLLDVSGDGVLSYKEFLEAFQVLQREEPELIDNAPWAFDRGERLFVELDISGDGLLQLDDMLQEGSRCPVGRWWQFLIKDNWGSTSHLSILGPLVLYGQSDAHDITKTLVEDLGLKHFSNTFDIGPKDDNTINKVTAFQESEILSEDQRWLRQLARKFGIPVPEVEEIYAVFSQFDTDKSGCIEFPEFQCLLGKMLEVEDLTDIPGDRMNMFWKQVDSSGNGEVDFSEFLVWYRGNFFTGNDNGAGSKGKGFNILKYFYASLATKRVVPVCATTIALWEESERVREAMEQMRLEEERLMVQKLQQKEKMARSRLEESKQKRRASGLVAPPKRPEPTSSTNEDTEMETTETESFRPGHRESMFRKLGSEANADEGLATITDAPEMRQEEDSLSDSCEGEESEGSEESDEEEIPRGVAAPIFSPCRPE